jgi:hypothetical protein
MADFRVTGQMKVKTFKEQFMECFGTVLRVYYKNRFADEDVTLASIRAEGYKGGDFDCSDNDIVGDFEDFMMALYGIEVQVASPDDSYLVDNNLRLCEVKNHVKATGKSRSKYSFNGEILANKGKLCRAMAKYYLQQNPDVTLEDIRKKFHVNGINAIESVEEALKTTDSVGTPGGSYYMKEADQIATKEGNVVVWNYWPERYFIGFIEITRKLGYTYEEV